MQRSVLVGHNRKVPETNLDSRDIKIPLTMISDSPYLVCKEADKILADDILSPGGILWFAQTIQENCNAQK
jgi:hypothetical protein